jgi:hypothetical protein
MFEFIKLSSEVIKEVSMLFDEIELQGVPYYFLQSNVVLKISKHPYLEDECGTKIFLGYNERVNDFVIYSYIIKTNKKTNVIEFEGDVEDYVFFFCENIKLFDADDIISMEIEIYKNGLTFDFFGQDFMSALEMEKHLMSLSECNSCGGLKESKKEFCSFCESAKNKPYSIYNRELQRVKKLHNGKKK